MEENTNFQSLGQDLSSTDISAVMMSGKMRIQSTESLHIHPFHQILVIKSGITLLEDKHQRQPLFGNMAAFLPAEVPHRSIIIGKSVAYQNIFLSKVYFDSVKDKIVVFDLSDLGMALFNRLSSETFIDSTKGFTRDCLDLFMQVVKKDIKHTSLLVRLPEPQIPHNKIITDYIEHHHQEKLRLRDINKLVPLSSRQIARVFQKDLNVTIFEYLKLYRIFMASTLLTDPEKSITEIAYQCGYETISCFYTDFRKLFSIPPRVFRKRFSFQDDKQIF